MASKQKKSRKATSRILTQKFDPRVRLISGAPELGGQNLDRGRLVHADNGTVIQFLHNPISVGVSHQFATHAHVDNMNDSSLDAATGMDNNVYAGGIGSISIPLLYDRTYETWDRSYKNTNAGRYGVYADVLAFYEFTGISPVNVQWRSLLWNDVDVWQSMYPTSFIVNTEAFLHIGKRLKYFGRIQSIDVTYTHFTQKMVPNRCVINVGMLLLSGDVAEGKTNKPKKNNKVDRNGFDPKKGLQ